MVKVQCRRRNWVSGFGRMLEDLGLDCGGVSHLDFRVQEMGFGVRIGLRVQGSGLRFEKLGCRVQVQGLALA